MVYALSIFFGVGILVGACTATIAIYLLSHGRRIPKFPSKAQSASYYATKAPMQSVPEFGSYGNKREYHPGAHVQNH
jgi:hypothetical protein